MIHEVEGTLDPTNLHIGIAVTSWNQAITDRLLTGARDRLDSLGIEAITTLRVPGALELPVAARTLIEFGCDAVVVIGAVIKGETDHYDIVVRESAAGVMQVSVTTGRPVTNAILAVHDPADAYERSAPGVSNKGAEAVEAAIRTANALRNLRKT